MGVGIKIRKTNSQFPKDIFAYTESQTIVPPIGTASIDIFLVGGGGGKGKDRSQSGTRTAYGWGGGGGSGYIYQSTESIACTHDDTLTIEIGGRGTDGTTSSAGTSGGQTKLYKNSTLIATADGGGAGEASVWSGSLATCGNGGAGSSGGGAGGAWMNYQGDPRFRANGGNGGSEGANGNDSVVTQYQTYKSVGTGGSGSGKTTRVFGINDGILTASGHYGCGVNNGTMVSTGYGDGQCSGAVFIRFNRA